MTFKGLDHLAIVVPVLWNWLETYGPGLHHFCLAVEDVSVVFKETAKAGLAPGEPRPYQGTQGKRALFLDPASTGGVDVELAGR